MRFTPNKTIANIRKHTLLKQWRLDVLLIALIALACTLALVLAWSASQPQATTTKQIKASTEYALKVEQISSQSALLLYWQLKVQQDFAIRGAVAFDANSPARAAFLNVFQTLNQLTTDINVRNFGSNSRLTEHSLDPLINGSNALSQKLEALERIDRQFIQTLSTAKVENAPAQAGTVNAQMQSAVHALNQAASSLSDLAGVQAQAAIDRSQEDEQALLRGIMLSAALAIVGAALLVYLLRKALRTNALLMRELSNAARIDPLTGLLNRRALEQRLVAEWGQPTHATSNKHILMMLDLDHFKQYNDTHGHVQGDAHLRVCALLWRSQVRANDVVARMGGEEFAVLMPNCDEEQALFIAQRLQSGMPKSTSFSAGIAQWRAGEDFNAWYQRADAALYQAKSQGRSRTVVAESLDEQPDSLAPIAHA